MSEVTAHVAYAASVYDLEFTLVKKFTGFSTISYLVRASPFSTHHTDTGSADDENSYVLKLCEIENDDGYSLFLQGQQKIMTYLRKHGFECPEFVRNKQDHLFSVWETPGGIKYGVHLLTYVSGCTLLEWMPLEEQVFVEVGVWLAQLRQSLKGLHIPEFTGHWSETATGHLWNMEHASGLKDHLDVIQEESLKQLFGDILDRFDEVVLPKQKQLERGIIHGDVHDENLIIMTKAPALCQGQGTTNAPGDDGEIPPQCSADGRPVRFGVIDFEELTVSWCVLDLVTAVASFMVAVANAPTRIPLKRLDIQGHEQTGYISPHLAAKDDHQDADYMLADAKYFDNNHKVSLKSTHVSSTSRNDYELGKMSSSQTGDDHTAVKHSTFGSANETHIPYYLHVGKLVLAGYQSRLPLSSLEKDVLFECICARYVQEIVLGTLSAQEDSTEDSTHMDYKLWFADRGSEQLKQMWLLGKERVLADWGL